MTIAWSAFPAGSAIQAADNIVGLQGGTNVKWTGTQLLAFVTPAAGSITNAMLAGSIAASKLIGTDIATVGTLTAGAIGAGFTAIANSALANSAVTIGSTSVSLGGTAATIAGLTLTAPALGAATATSINKVAITQPANGSTLTIPDGVTLNAGAGGTLGSNAFTSTAFAPLASPTFTGTVTGPDASTWTSSGLTIASGKTLRLGNAATTGLTAGVLSALTNASVVILDSTGQAYRVPCII